MPVNLGHIQDLLEELAELGGEEELKALHLVLTERIRQMRVEGFSPEHDDTLRREGQLAAAGACYLLATHQRNIAFVRSGRMESSHLAPLPAWPFGRVLWKPASPSRMTVKGTALALAELVRHLRSGLP